MNPNGGGEVDEYEALGLSPLPRNNKLEYREEALMIPDSSDFFQPDSNGVISAFRIIPPLGMKQIKGKDNFFATDENNFTTDGQFTETEVEAIVTARKAWEDEKIPLEESLDHALLSRLKSKYSMKETGIYTIMIEASPGENLPGKQFTCTVEVPVNLVSGRDFRFYEWRFLR